jgi:YebC/PmpR family DNA-binding regulatory protein
MAGHSKWSKIKRQKAANDNKRGANFSKYSREIQVAAREGGSDVAANLRLRMAVDRAKRDGMPNDTIERAIAKGGGATTEADSYETVIYEGYGPGGVAVMAIALTDNRNRTAAEVRGAFNRHGGSLGETGNVSWQFDTVGQITVTLNGHDADEIELQAIDAGASDVVTEEDAVVITTDPVELTVVADNLRESGLEIEDMGITRLPQVTVDLEGGQASTAMRLLEALDDLDDVSDVYTNASFVEEQEPATA